MIMMLLSPGVHRSRG